VGGILPYASDTVRCASDTVRCASGKGPLRERRKGAADQCRSDEQTHLGSAVSSLHERVFAKRDEQVGDKRPCASATSIKWVKLRSSMS
jgi:hypothetical protein